MYQCWEWYFCQSFCQSRSRSFCTLICRPIKSNRIPRYHSHVKRWWEFFFPIRSRSCLDQSDNRVITQSTMLFWGEYYCISSPTNSWASFSVRFLRHEIDKDWERSSCYSINQFWEEVKPISVCIHFHQQIWEFLLWYSWGTKKITSSITQSSSFEERLKSLCEYFSKKSLYFNILAHFRQFIKYMLFRFQG